MISRPSSYITFFGSSTGTLRAANTRSHSMPVSFGARRTRTRRSGCCTSMASGPTTVWARSWGARREPWKLCCTPPTTTLKCPSITRRFGYNPNPISNRNAPSRSKPLNQ